MHFKVKQEMEKNALLPMLETVVCESYVYSEMTPITHLQIIFLVRRIFFNYWNNSFVG